MRLLAEISRRTPSRAYSHCEDGDYVGELETPLAVDPKRDAAAAAISTRGGA